MARSSVSGLFAKVLAEVNERGQVTIPQVVALLGTVITAAYAANVGRRMVAAKRKRNLGTRPEKVVHTESDFVARGRREVAQNVLGGLYRKGRICRVSKGVYARLWPERGRCRDDG